MFEKRKKEEKKSGRQDSKKGKKVKKRKEEYVELRGLLGVGKDYHVYHMTPADYLISWGDRDWSRNNCFVCIL